MIGRLYVWQGVVWLLLVRGEPFDTRRGGPARNVLIERLVPLADVSASWGAGAPPEALPLLATGRGVFARTGDRVVRPFRGLRRWKP